jgi:hypothetical protein
LTFPFIGVFPSGFGSNWSLTYLGCSFNSIIQAGKGEGEGKAIFSKKKRRRRRKEEQE